MTNAGTARPVPLPPREYLFPRIIRASLANGLRVAVAPLRRLPLVTAMALVDAGDAQDASGVEGLAALTAQALAEGTTRRDGAALTDAFELLGTGLNTTSDWDESSAQLTVTPPRLPAAMALLGETLLTPSFDARAVDRLKAERGAELLQQRMEPRALADEKFDETLYAEGSRYAMPAGGSRASVNGLDSGKVRGFHAAQYAPSVTTLVVVGDVTEEQVFPLAQDAFGAWIGSARLRPTATEDLERASASRVHIVDKAGAPQTELRL